MGSFVARRLESPSKAAGFSGRLRYGVHRADFSGPHRIQLSTAFADGVGDGRLPALLFASDRNYPDGGTDVLFNGPVSPVAGGSRRLPHRRTGCLSDFRRADGLGKSIGAWYRNSVKTGNFERKLAVFPQAEHVCRELGRGLACYRNAKTAKSERTESGLPMEPLRPTIERP